MGDIDRDPRGDPCACGDPTEWHQECYAERLKVQRGPFTGKDQQWFTRAEVIALLQGKDGVLVPAELFRRILERLDFLGPSWAEHRAGLATELRALLPSGVTSTPKENDRA